MRITWCTRVRPRGASVVSRRRGLETEPMFLTTVLVRVHAHMSSTPVSLWTTQISKAVSDRHLYMLYLTHAQQVQLISLTSPMKTVTRTARDMGRMLLVQLAQVSHRPTGYSLLTRYSHLRRSKENPALRCQSLGLLRFRNDIWHHRWH